MAAEVDANGATITWTLYDLPSAAALTSFRVTRNSQPSGGEWVEVGTLAASGAEGSLTFSLNDPAAQQGTIYYYAIEGYDANGAQTLLGMTTTAQPWQPTMLPIVGR